MNKVDKINAILNVNNDSVEPNFVHVDEFYALIEVLENNLELTKKSYELYMKSNSILQAGVRDFKLLLMLDRMYDFGGNIYNTNLVTAVLKTHGLAIKSEELHEDIDYDFMIEYTAECIRVINIFERLFADPILEDTQCLMTHYRNAIVQPLYKYCCQRFDATCGAL